MKKVFKKILIVFEIVLKICLILAIFLGCFGVLNNVFYNRDIEDASAFKSLPDNSMDIVVLGSSHSEYSFIPSLIYANNGLYSYVLGTACQPYEVSYQMLREAYKTQSPKLVVMEVYTAMPLRSICEEDSCYVLAEYQMSGQEKINTINYLNEDKAKDYYFDYLNYHNDWRNIDSLSQLKPRFMQDPVIDYSFGYIYQPSYFKNTDNYWRAYNTHNYLDVELDERDAESLNSILELCKENGSELLLYKTPIDGLDEENISYLHKVWEWAEEKGIKYVDLIEESHDLNFYMSYHSSSFHAYVNGAGIITNRLAEEINKNGYEFNHVNIDELEERYNANSQEMICNYLYYENNPLTYMNVVKHGKGIFAIRYIKSRSKLPVKFINDLKEMGIEDFDGNNNLFAVFKDGKVISYSTDSINNFEYNKMTFNINSNEINLNGTGYSAGKDCLLNFIYVNEYSGNVVDKYLNYQGGWFWDLNSFYYLRNWD